jgi:hypothetical protein
MLGTTPALLLALGLPSVFAAGWDAVYNVDRRANSTSLRSRAPNTALLHTEDRTSSFRGREPGQPGSGFSNHGWTRSGSGPDSSEFRKFAKGHEKERVKGGGKSEESNSKWFWGEDSNDESTWGGPGYFGSVDRHAAGDKEIERVAAAASGVASPTDDTAPVALSASQDPCAKETITVQPSTRGQDEGSCGWLDLPERFFMRVKVRENMAMKGDWENDSGAQYVEFVQDLFAWQYETVYFYTGSKLFAKTEVIENEEVQLPSVKLKNAQENEKNFYTIAVKDCNDVLMYVLREKRTSPYLYEIYNRDDQLVAYSEFGSLHVDKMYWYDHLKKPIAIAQSPRLLEKIYRLIDDRADPYFGNVPTWEIKFLKGYDPTAIVTIMQNRWVIAAAVQERAIRNAARGPDGKPKPPEAFPWFVGLTVFFLVVCVGAVAYCFYWIFRLVYPKSYKEVDNKFLKQDKNIYGELVQGRYGTSM